MATESILKGRETGPELTSAPFGSTVGTGRAALGVGREQRGFFPTTGPS